MSWLYEIHNFLEDYSGVYPKDPNIDIFGEMSVAGDDFHEMMENYSKVYDVDMTNYLWYFHCDEEGQNIGGLFFKPPYKRVERIPITPELLAEFIVTKKWDIAYPDHELPSKRKDFIFNQILAFLTFIGIIIILLLKILR